MPRVARKSAERTIGVKYSIELDARIRRIEETLAAKSVAPVSLSFVMTQITTRGLDAYEQELGITSTPTKPIKAA